jgi:hypothetical protein
MEILKQSSNYVIFPFFAYTEGTSTMGANISPGEANIGGWRPWPLQSVSKRGPVD